MEKYKYRLKDNVGPHYIGTVCYEPGDLIKLTEANAAKILNKLISLEPKPEEKPEPEPTVRLQIIEADDGWDVVNPNTGKAINNESVSLEQAKQIAGSNAEVIETPKADPPTIKAVHRGGGKFILAWEKDSTPVSSKLYTRAEADEIFKQIIAGELTLEELE